LLSPNRWRDPADLARRMGAEALLLTGGNDVGKIGGCRDVAPERDRTEESLLDWASAAGIPVLGVCRGAQMMNQYAGGKVRRVHPLHSAAAHQHRVEFEQRLELPPSVVNSYHEWGIARDDLAPIYDPMAASSDDGSVEAFLHRGLPWFGILWHPERAEPGPPDLLARLGSFLREGTSALSMADHGVAR
jgi:putative glutamine amidotransferase